MANVEFGVREFLVLVVALLKFYERHQQNIDGHLNGGEVSALHTLLQALPTIEAMQIIGPNYTTPHEGGL